MDILQLIDRLEELFNESKNIPLTRNVMVDEDRMLDIIDQMRIAIPEEVKKAQQLLGQRDRVLAQAQEEANRTLEIARQKADQLASKEIVMQEAQRRADQILVQARADAETVRSDAQVDYMLFPRLLAFAERAWHRAGWEPAYRAGASYTFGDNAVDITALRKGWSEFSAKMPVQLAQLERSGVGYRRDTAGVDT